MAAAEPPASPDPTTMMLYFRLMRPVARMEMTIERSGVIQPLTVDAIIEKGRKQEDLTGDHIWDLIREEQSEEAKADERRKQIPKLDGFYKLSDHQTRHHGRLVSCRARARDRRAISQNDANHWQRTIRARPANYGLTTTAAAVIAPPHEEPECGL